MWQRRGRRRPPGGLCKKRQTVLDEGTAMGSEYSGSIRAADHSGGLRQTVDADYGEERRVERGEYGGRGTHDRLADCIIRQTRQKGRSRIMRNGRR